MAYNMYILWDNDCNFVFQSWHSTTAGGLAFGIIFTFIVSFLSTGFPFLKKHILNRNRIEITVAFLLNYLIKLFIMFLIMAMNGYVCGAIIAGMTFGQLFFEYWTRMRKQTKSKSSRDEALLFDPEAEHQKSPQRTIVTEGKQEIQN